MASVECYRKRKREREEEMRRRGEKPSESFSAALSSLFLFIPSLSSSSLHPLLSLLYKTPPLLLFPLARGGVRYPARALTAPKDAYTLSRTSRSDAEWIRSMRKNLRVLIRERSESLISDRRRRDSKKEEEV